MKERVRRAGEKKKKTFQKRDIASTEEREEALSLEGYFAGLSWGSSNTGSFGSFSRCACCRPLKQGCLSHILIGAYLLLPLIIRTFLFGLAILILAESRQIWKEFGYEVSSNAAPGHGELLDS